jgi:flagellar biosynthesis regulator FlaF
MKKIVIEGKTYTLLNRDEVTYGAEKQLERAQFAASLAMLSDKDVAELASKSKEEGKDINEEEFMNRVMSGEIKNSLLDSHDAALSEEEEAIILSVGIAREELLKMPGKIVKRLAVAAIEELGPAEDFSEASTTDTN